jgi:hypothetical protein
MDATWHTHDWVPPDGRVLEIEGQFMLHDRCTVCGRDFVEEIDSGLKYAVHVLAFNFARLSDEVTSRWMSSECPGVRLASDDADRRTRFIGA